MRLAGGGNAVKIPPECALSDITTHEKENPALMNKNQKILLIIVAIVLVAMLLYPPFVRHGAHGVEANAGYRFIWDTYGRAPKPVVSLMQLFFQILIVAIVGGIGSLVLRDDKIERK